MSDIAINPVTRRVQFTGNTGTGPFAFTFNVLNSSDIAVYKNTTLLTLTADYTVTIAANGTGSVTLQSGQAVISSDYVTIIGGRNLERTTDFVTAGDLLASSLNEQLDSNVIMSQQLDESFGRALSVSPGDVDVSMTLPVASSRANQIVAFTSTGAVTTTNLNTLPELTVDKLNVDNLTLDGNTISTTNSNGNLILTPNGTGDVVVSGDLVVNGTTTTIHSTVVDIADKNITIAYGSSDAAAANGAGITVDGADATMNYYSTPDGWEFNKAVTVGYTGSTPQDLGGVLNVYSSSSSVPGMVIKSSGTSVDPKIQFEQGSNIWTIGQDASADDFKIINGTNLNSSAEIHINTDGDVALGGVSHYSNYELSVPQRVAIRSGSAVAGIDFAASSELVFDGNVGGTNGSFAKFRFASSEADKMVIDGTTLKAHAFASISGTGVSITDDLKFGDDKKAVFGDSTDLSVYFDATANKSYISHTGSGDYPVLELNTDGYDMRFMGSGSFMIRATPGADVKLYHAGSTKLATSASGVVITGSITADSYNLPGVLSLADGSNSAPSLTNTGDTNTGLYFPAADEVGLTVGGTQRLNVSATGIDVTGTILADGLTVDGTPVRINSTAPMLNFMETGVTDSNHRIRQNAGNLYFQKLSDDEGTSTTRMVIDGGTGDISFYEDTGTTAKFFWDAADESLDIGGVTTSTLASLRLKTAGSNNAIALNIEENSGNEGWGLGVNAAGDLKFYNSGTGTATGLSAVTFSDDNNVGIGTSSPAALLDLKHNSASTHLRLTENTSGNWSALGVDTSDNLRIYTNNSEAMRISSSGLVGIGTSSPAAPLSISGSAFNPAAGGYATGGIDLQGATAGNGNYTAGLGFRMGTRQSTAIITGVQDTTDSDRVGLAFFTNPDGSGATAADEVMRISSSGNVGIGVVPESWLSAYTVLQIGDAGSVVGSTDNSFVALGANAYLDSTNSRYEYINSDFASQYYQVDGTHVWRTAASGTADAAITFDSAMTLDASGNLLVGKTSAGIGTAGFQANPTGDTYNTVSGNITAYYNRLSSDGDIVQFRKDGTTVGSIGVVSTDQFYFAAADGAGLKIDSDASSGCAPCNSSGADLDNSINVGHASNRWNDIYATNGTIQTSDRNEKQDIAELSDAEQRVAVAAKGLLRKFRWRDAVAEKGDEARTHFGIIAQDLQAAFAAEGLDAGDYAMFISSTWTDEETGEERTRMGVRYSELLAFIIAAI